MERLVAWTGAWTLFEWWAVIGWPEELERIPAALVLSGAAALVGLVVWRDVREPRIEPGAANRVIPLRSAGGRPGRSPGPAPEDEELAA